jgi:hypothetical protein
MRNRFPGTCYFCGKICKAGEGHFEQDGFVAPGSRQVRWKTIHAECVFEQRKQKDSSPSPR